MSPLQFKQLLENIKNQIPEINKSWVVVDDSQLTSTLGEVEREDNILLVGVLPNYGTRGANADSYGDTTYGLIFVLEKTDYSELTYDEFIDLFERTYQTTKKVRNLMLYFAVNSCSSFLRNIYVDSLGISPEWKKAGCNGWSLEFEIG